MLDVQKVSYFHATAANPASEARGVLELLGRDGVNLLGFTATPIGPVHTQYTLFPEDPATFERVAGQAGLQAMGPHHAIMIRGEDKVGALEAVFRKLESADVHVYSSTALAGRGGAFSLLVYLRPNDVDRAVEALAA